MFFKNISKPVRGRKKWSTAKMKPLEPSIVRYRSRGPTPRLARDTAQNGPNLARISPPPPGQKTAKIKKFWGNVFLFLSSSPTILGWNWPKIGRNNEVMTHFWGPDKASPFRRAPNRVKKKQPKTQNFFQGVFCSPHHF